MLKTQTARRLILVAILALAPLVGLVGGAATAQADDSSDGVDLTVKVVGSGHGDGHDREVATPARPAAYPNTAEPGSVPGVRQTTVKRPRAVTAALGNDPFNLGGVLYLSGLTARSVPAMAPNGGDIVMDFTVRNVSSAPVTSSLKFWLDNAVGIRIALVDNVRVADLASGETRTVTATLKNTGQWTVFNGHVMVTPPAAVKGAVLSALTRDALVIVPPYFLLLDSVIVAGLYLPVRHLIRARRMAPATSGGVAS